jgi:hypothetical protein
MNSIAIILTVFGCALILAWIVAFFKFMYLLLKGYKIPTFFYLW